MEGESELKDDGEGGRGRPSETPYFSENTDTEKKIALDNYSEK